MVTISLPLFSGRLPLEFRRPDIAPVEMPAQDPLSLASAAPWQTRHRGNGNGFLDERIALLVLQCRFWNESGAQSLDFMRAGA